VSPSTRLAAAVLAAFALTTGPLPAQEARPAPQVNKLTIYNGTAKSVTYMVQGGSPRLRARFRLLQFAENEVTLLEQLQQLKTAYVANELALEGFRAGGPPANAAFFGRESSIKIAMADTLAREATPQAAFRLIDLLEQAETEVETELQKLPPEQRDKLLRQLHGTDRRAAGPQAAPAGPPAPGPAAPPANGDKERRDPFSPVTLVAKQSPPQAPAATTPLPVILRAGDSAPQNRSAGSDPAWLAVDRAPATFEQVRAVLDSYR
jgi:hypothetical protein